MLLDIECITKKKKKKEVLKKVNLKIEAGECHCLIGKNGSGKSTLINMIIDVVEPDEGIIKFSGDFLNDPASAVKSKIGVLPEFNPVIDEFSIQDYLEYVGLIYKMDKELIRKRSEFLIQFFFEEPPSSKKIIGSFSTGMKMKTGIWAALVHKPELLILDEPFDGMDIFSANNMVSFLNDYKEKGNAILVSSHDMLYMEKVATHVSIIKDAEILSFPMSYFHANNSSFEKQISELLGYNPKELPEFE
ncbi:MAG: ABC transporter ATP-binding protein [Balneolales bacterium]|nr:ABC transporter ATP-binding protein [Balneolales bacterium]